MIGQKPIVDCGAFVAHDALGPATFATAEGLIISVRFDSDASGKLRTEQAVRRENLTITFFNADGPTDFNDFTISYGGRSFHLLIFVVSIGPAGRAARQISYSLLENR